MNIKSKLFETCLQLVSTKIRIVEAAMKDAQKSANSEQNSTAGDKYNTARAMSHIEIDMYSKQLKESMLLKKNLDSVIVLKESKEVISGSLVYTKSGNYFIAVGLGKVSLAGQDFFVISPISPIGKELFGKKAGDSIKFQGRLVEIIDLK